MPTSDRPNPSHWIVSAPAAPTRPGLTGDATADVVIVGGGITGLTTALLLLDAGASVLVLERGSLAAGTTGSTTAKVTSLHGLTYARLLDEQGEEKARQYAEANQAAIGLVEELVARTGADCQLERRDAITYTTDPTRVGEIEAEVAAARQLGLPASSTTDTGLPYPVAAAVRFADQAQLHPRRYCLALADAVEAAGGRIHESTPVLDVDERDGGVVVETAGGLVRGGHAVLATLLPFLDVGAYFAKAHPYRSYAMTVRVADGAELPKAMCYGVDSPSRSTRTVRFDDGTEGLVLGGNGHKTGEEPDTPAQYADLEQWARGTFAVTSVEQRWSAQDFVPDDGVPYVGRSARTRNVLVATGFKKWGMSGGTAAASILRDAVLGREHPHAAVFDAARVDAGPSLKSFVKENLDVAKELATGLVERLTPNPGVDTLGPGEGGIVNLDGTSVAAYRADDGTLTAVSPVCIHLGCTVAWNPAEVSWDCPCHGSRFDPTGAVLNGPAVDPLEPVDPDPR